MLWVRYVPSSVWVLIDIIVSEEEKEKDNCDFVILILLIMLTRNFNPYVNQLYPFSVQLQPINQLYKSKKEKNKLLLIIVKVINV